METNKYSSIQFRPTMYRVFRNIPNTPWNALCEFIDNSIQAALNSNLQGQQEIAIKISNDSIVIKDQGPGFSENDLASGLEPARIPEDRTQLNEFGMGMKLAALYFGDRYKIESSNGNSLKSTLIFDLDEVTKSELTQIPIKQEPYSGKPFTCITIEKISNDTRIDIGLDLEKIKRQIAEVYTVFINDGSFRIVVNDFALTVPEISVLEAPWYKDINGPQKLWLENFSIESGEFGISGYVALRDPMSSANRGFKLVRRGRVVDGINSNVKPHIIFGTPGSHLSKRLTGMIHLKGFGISFNKTELLNNADLEKCWGQLKTYLNSLEQSILKQGKEFRLPKKSRISTGQNDKVISTAIKVPVTKPNPKVESKKIQLFNLKIGSFDEQIYMGTTNGKFIQSVDPKIILRSDFFSSAHTRSKLIEVLQTFHLNTNADLDRSTLIKLIDLLWLVLK